MQLSVKSNFRNVFQGLKSQINMFYSFHGRNDHFGPKHAKGGKSIMKILSLRPFLFVFKLQNLKSVQRNLIGQFLVAIATDQKI